MIVYVLVEPRRKRAAPKRFRVNCAGSASPTRLITRGQAAISPLGQQGLWANVTCPYEGLQAMWVSIDTKISTAYSHMQRTRCDSSYDAEPEEEPTQHGELEFNVADAVDDLRQLVTRVDAVITAAESHLDE